MSEQDALTTQSLIDQSTEVERLADSIFRAAEGRRPLPTSLADALKQIADLTSECEEAIAGQLDGTLPKEALSAVATALGAIRGGIDSLVVYQALEGTSYETRTVAND